MKRGLDISSVALGWGGTWPKCGRYCILIFVFCIGGATEPCAGIKVTKLNVVV